jgi:uncharacterized membrane protein YgcG
MTMRRFLVFFLAATLLLGGVASAQQQREAFPIPDRCYTLVNDYFDVLPSSTAARITEKLQALERRNGTQIVILTVPFVGGNVQEYAGKVFHKWDLGNNGQGNGVLFLFSEDGWRIETGPGIAGALPDSKIARLFWEAIEPHWNRGEFSEGIEAGIDEMIRVAKEEDTAPTSYDYQNPCHYSPAPTRIENVLITALAAFGVVFAGVLLYRRVRRNRCRR